MSTKEDTIDLQFRNKVSNSETDVKFTYTIYSVETAKKSETTPYIDGMVIAIITLGMSHLGSTIL